MDWLTTKASQLLRPTASTRDSSSLIDVRELMKSLGDEELLQAADEYFAGLSIESEQCYKPFSNVNDAIHMHRHLALVLQAASLFRGADVVDFGCGTGWLTLSLASLGCQVVGVDVSANAIDLSRKLMERRGVRQGGGASFSVYKGGRLPLEDESVDRIVCFDAFHHVKDQAATLREFARVLRPGGRVAMLEPGPNHSRTAQSQLEMSRFKVIENDIDMAVIARHASAVGLGPPTMLVQLPHPLELPIGEYLAWEAAAEMPNKLAQDVNRKLTRHLTNLQCSFMEKPGAARFDSRQPESLAAELKLLSAQRASQDVNCWRFRMRVKNIGEGVWRTQTGGIAEVNLGVQLVDAIGLVANNDFLRISLGNPDLAPGEARILEFEVLLPNADTPALRFDLVSELVCWFSDLGRTTPATWQAMGVDK